MKTRIAVFGLTILLSAVGLSQNVSDSTGRRPQQRQHKGFVDQNGDGINDPAQQRRERMQARKDRFIDANGDGICDNRESGLGFRRGSAAAGNGMGNKTGKKGHGGK